MSCSSCKNCNCKTVTLTENEDRVLKVLAKTERYYDEAGEPGYSDVMLEDIIAETGKEAKSIRGVLGSLIKKDLVFTQDVNGEYNIYYLTGTARERLGLETDF